MRVYDIMATDVQSSGVNTSLDTVASKMWQHNCSAIPIVDSNDRPMGMITDSDIAMCCKLNHKAPWELEALTVIANREHYVCWKDDDIDIAMALMKDRKIRRLAVADNDGHLVGVLSIDDVVSCFIKEKPAQKFLYDTAMHTLKVVTIQH